MKYFSYIDNNNSIFYKRPTSFNMTSNKELLSHALGATLYMGGNRPNLLKDVLSSKGCSIVICLEDSVSYNQLGQAEQNVIKFFEDIEMLMRSDRDLLDKLPLLFLRVRDLKQHEMLLRNSNLTGLCGFVLPKFCIAEGEKHLSLIKSYNALNDKTLYALPILETPEVIYKDSRINELLDIKKLLDYHKELILNVRIGGTDFSGIYSLRRSKDFTIYDLAVINDCIGDIINIFQRDGYVISAPVNEHFSYDNPLDESGLVREILLDKQNGLVGKTVIHPTQVPIVNSLLAVTKEEYLDAEAIVNSISDGVIRSSYRNKMNEVKPHLKWAYKTLLLSNIMGVLNDGKTYKDILRLSENSSYMPEPKDIVEYIRREI